MADRRHRSWLQHTPLKFSRGRDRGDRFTTLLPPAHPYARHLAPPGPTWQLPLPFLDRVISLPARILRTADGHLTLLLPPAHPYARRLAPPGHSWQLPLPFLDLATCDAHF